MCKRNIIFIINSLSCGGAEKVLVNLANGLVQSGFMVTITSLWQGTNADSLDPKVRLRSLIKNEPNAFTGLLIKAFEKLIPNRLIAKIMLRGKYDLAVAYLEGFPTNILAKSKTDTKCVAFIHSDLSNGYVLHKVYSSKEECLSEYQSFDGVAFVSKVAQIGFEKSIGHLDNAKVIYNVMDCKNILMSANEKCENIYSTDVIKLIAVGRLSTPKSFDRLINVIYRINNAGFKCELLILGDGDLRMQLIEQRDKLGCSNIHFMGFQKNPYKYIRQADLMICSSLYEGYSTTAIESLLLGVPVLTTDCAGMAEILEVDRFGLIVENDEDHLFEGLRSLLDNPDRIQELKNNVKYKRQLLSSKEENLQKNIDYFNRIIYA